MKPAGDDAGALKVADGATLAICTVAVSVSESPLLSVARTVIVFVPGPSSVPTSNVAVDPGVSNVPSPSKSHANEIASPSGSSAVGETGT